MKLNAIYTITNKENGKVYVGESSDVIQRWHSHRKHLKEGTHNSKKLQADWNKYGEDAIIQNVNNISIMVDEELKYAMNGIKQKKDLKLSLNGL